MNFEIGKKIRGIRKAKGLNQTQMAKELGVHLQTLSRYEREELVPGPEILSVLAEKFDLDVNLLLKGGKLPEGETFAVKELQVPYSAPKVSTKSEAIRRIVVVLEGMSEEKVFEVLKYTEEKKELLFYQAMGRGTRTPPGGKDNK